MDNKLITDKLKSFYSEDLVLIIFIFLIGAAATFVNPRFLSFRNLLNILQQVSVLGIIASGVGMLLVAGEIDISVGSQVSLIGVIVAMIVQSLYGLPGGNPPLPALTPFIPLIAVLAALVVGFLCGLANGLIVINTNAPSFIITLGSRAIFKGVALLITGGASFMMFGKFQTFGRTKIFNYLPYSVFFFLGAIVLVYVVLKYTKYGRFLYAIGGNEEAAFVSGVKVKLVTLRAFIVVGLLNALAAIVLVSRVGSALANIGDGFALDALAAIIVGGVSLYGGKGSAGSVFLGVLLIGLLSNALVIMNVNPFIRNIAIGAITIIAVVSRQYGGGSNKFYQ